MSFFDRQEIQEALLCRQSSTADDGFEEDVLALRDYSFVTVTRDASTFEMHSLVQLATRTWLENEGQLDKWREQFILNLCAELPTGEHKNWKKCQALFPHTRAALAQRPKNRESLVEWALLLYKAAWYAWQRGRAGEAEEMAMMSMEVRSEELVEEDAETLSSMGMVGLARELGGKYEEAETMHRQMLARREKVLGPEHPDTLASTYCLAHLLTHQQRYNESIALYERACAGYQAVLGKDHPTTRACRQHYTDALASHEQSQLVISPTTAGSTRSARTGKGSKLLRGLAKMGIRSSKSSAR